MKASCLAIAHSSVCRLEILKPQPQADQCIGPLPSPPLTGPVPCCALRQSALAFSNDGGSPGSEPSAAGRCMPTTSDIWTPRMVLSALIGALWLGPETAGFWRWRSHWPCCLWRACWQVLRSNLPGLVINSPSRQKRIHSVVYGGARSAHCHDIASRGVIWSSRCSSTCTCVAANDLAHRPSVNELVEEHLEARFGPVAAHSPRAQGNHASAEITPWHPWLSLTRELGPVL